MLLTVKLGDFTFDYFEIPESLRFGGDHENTVHQLVGGERVVNAMGRADSDITLSGYFLGITAAERAQYINGLRIKGDMLPFSYAQFKYNVFIKSFYCDFERPYQIPYSMTLLVVEDLTKPIDVVFPATSGDVIQNALEEALTIAELVNNPGLDSALALLGVAIQNIPDFSNASIGQIAGVASLVNNAQSVVNGIINGL